MMNSIRYRWIKVLQTLLRVLPFPCRTGLIVIGQPHRDAPVLLTCNFRLTVERVRRALTGLDCYLLVANSGGVNVWCAATGGLLTNHDVISVLKTSGIEQRVNHRQVILPQLAATGIERQVIAEKIGWTVIWGPVEAAQIPAFLNAGCDASEEMRRVEFRWPQRIEMAIAWAFPISVVMALLLVPWWWKGVLPMVGVVWGLAFAVFLSFPLYERFLHHRGKRIGFVFFDFGQHAVPVVLWAFLLAGWIGWMALTQRFSWMLALRGGVVSLVVVLILCLDLMGSTPVFKSGLHADRLLNIVLDVDRCRGAAFCQQVCPTRVFDMDPLRGQAVLPRVEQCVQCGACIVQCPCDALSFEHPDGLRVMPETIRTFKLNLLGERLRVRNSNDG